MRLSNDGTGSKKRRSSINFAACQLIPGPTSTELAILGLAWVYMRYASSPIVAGALHGIRRVVVGIIAWALIDLGRRILRGPWPVVTGLGVMVAALLGWNRLATPGPVFTVATFIGFLVAGIVGAVVATLGMSCRALFWCPF